RRVVALDLLWRMGPVLRKLGLMKKRFLNRFQIEKLRRASRRTQLIAVGAAFVLFLLSMLPTLTRPTSARWFALESAKQAFRHAQAENADAWAPDELRSARAMLHVAMVEHRVQELRFYPFRDFSQAEALLHESEKLSTRAVQVAIRTRQAARDSAREAITRAAESVGRGVQFSNAMQLTSYDRRTLTRSRMSLEEAEILHRRGLYDIAATCARSALEGADHVTDRAAQAASRYTDAALVQSWRRWIQDTVGWSARTGACAIVVLKDKHQLSLYSDGQLVKVYHAELGVNSIANKWHAGDSATPEGRYHIAAKKPPGQSGYYMALLLDYPSLEDRRRFDEARRAGRLPRNASLGNLIEIHGEGGRGKDW